MEPSSLLTHGDVAVRLARGIRVSDSGCWEWQGVQWNGYGRISATARKKAITHRLAYEVLVGPIPDGLELDHLCRNKACCNPAHLEPVTHAENVRRSWLHREPVTHCIRGHELTPENVHVKAGKRNCRACHRLHQAAYVARRMERAA